MLRVPVRLGSLLTYRSAGRFRTMTTLVSACCWATSVLGYRAARVRPRQTFPIIG